MGGVCLQRTLPGRLLRLFLLPGGVVEGVALVVVVDLRDPVRDVVDHVEPGDVLPVEEVHRLGFALAEDRDEHVGAGDLLLARGLHVEDRALEDALESEGRLCLAFVLRREHRRVLVEIARERAAQLLDLDPARAQHLAGGGIVEQGEQQVLDGHELVPLLAGVAEGAVEGELQLLAQHVVSPRPGSEFSPAPGCGRGYDGIGCVERGQGARRTVKYLLRCAVPASLAGRASHPRLARSPGRSATGTSSVSGSPCAPCLAFALPLPPSPRPRFVIW